MQITKNQHYVPQLLLRRFATPGGQKDRIVVCDIERGQFRKNQNICKVGSQNYFYDKDNGVERFIADNIETPAAPAIAAILDAPATFSGAAPEAIQRFVAAQLSRTPEAYEQGQQFINAFSRTMFKEYMRLNGHDQAAQEAAGRLTVVPSDPGPLIAYQTISGSLDWWLLRDLDAHVVINGTNRDFVLADHPVFLHNWYLRDVKHPAATSIARRGAQIFMPLSSRVTLCLFDSDVYAYGSRRFQVTYVEDASDVDILNGFQALSASDFIYFGSDSMEASVRRLADRYRHLRPFTFHASHTEARPNGRGTMSSLHMTWKVQQRIDRMPSFVRVKSKVRKQPPVCEDRKPDVVAALDYFKKRAREQT